MFLSWGINRNGDALAQVLNGSKFPPGQPVVEGVFAVPRASDFTETVGSQMPACLRVEGVGLMLQGQGGTHGN